VSTILWTTLITAVATVSASLDAVWIKGHFDDLAEVRRAKEARVAATSDRRREAYAKLLTIARDLLTVERTYQAFMEASHIGLSGLFGAMFLNPPRI
jgi:hypothetical protein